MGRKEEGETIKILRARGRGKDLIKDWWREERGDRRRKMKIFKEIEKRMKES